MWVFPEKKLNFMILSTKYGLYINCAAATVKSAITTRTSTWRPTGAARVSGAPLLPPRVLRVLLLLLLSSRRRRRRRYRRLHLRLRRRRYHRLRLRFRRSRRRPRARSSVPRRWSSRTFCSGVGLAVAAWWPLVLTSFYNIGRRASSAILPSLLVRHLTENSTAAGPWTRTSSRITSIPFILINGKQSFIKREFFSVFLSKIIKIFFIFLIRIYSSWPNNIRNFFIRSSNN